MEYTTIILEVHILSTHHITVLVKLESTLDHAFKLCLKCGGREQLRKSSMVLEDVDGEIQI